MANPNFQRDRQSLCNSYMQAIGQRGGNEAPSQALSNPDFSIFPTSESINHFLPQGNGGPVQTYSMDYMQPMSSFPQKTTRQSAAVPGGRQFSQTGMTFSPSVASNPHATQMFPPQPQGVSTSNSQLQGGSTSNSQPENWRNPTMIPTKVEAFARVSAFGDEDDLYNVFDDDNYFGKVQKQSSSANTHFSGLDVNGMQGRSAGQRQIPPATNSRPREMSRGPGDPVLNNGNKRKTENHPVPESSDFLLPSTLIPPSVLASNSNFCTDKKRSVPKKDSHKRQKSQQAIKPQDFLEDLLKKNGIATKRIPADAAEYDTVPSVLQLASFGTHLVKAVHTGDAALLSELLECGLSPNPCNQFRDSIIDLVCKRANTTIFECLLDHGSDLQVADGFGRTPLHHACWASTFCPSIVEKILQRDPIQLYIEDKHGQTPLEYVRSDLREDWVSFLESKVLLYFNSNTKLEPPKNRRPQGTLADPPNALSVNLASMLSSGEISPAQISQMDERTRRSQENSSF